MFALYDWKPSHSKSLLIYVTEVENWGYTEMWCNSVHKDLSQVPL